MVSPEFQISFITFRACRVSTFRTQLAKLLFLLKEFRLLIFPFINKMIHGGAATFFCCFILSVY